jgi:uncharacterized protein
MSLVDEGLELLSDDECRYLLGSASVGRVGVSVNALPVIVPVNYGFAGDMIRFWSGPGLKLRAAQAQTVVAFEVDDFDPENQRGWSVLAVGLAAEVRDAGVLDAAARDGFGPWVEGERSHLIEIRIEFLSGRRIVPTSMSPNRARNN